jgi:hypothetical protein
VNQPDAWWDDPAKAGACSRNAATISVLRNFREFEIDVTDRSSRGNGWKGKQHGVGYARKTVMDRINQVAGPGDIMVSLDADTVFGENYLRSVAENFAENPTAAALAVPYYHNAPADPVAARAILRYEIYMRHYFLNLFRIGSPYAFTALGSAMALPVRAYRAIGGMTPKLSGEDFYFLQKLRKYGEILLWNEDVVYPEARFSDRVFFGTGPAMIKGAAGDWVSYPIYPQRFFDAIHETCSLLPQLYSGAVDTPVVRFLSDVFREADPFQPLRINHRDPLRFNRAFHEKFDGLRILQYLKKSKENDPATDEENLWNFLETINYMEDPLVNGINRREFSLETSPTGELEVIRDYLYRKEMEARLSSKPV